MTSAGAPRLVVAAALRVRVTDPRGRTATVVVDDHEGAVRVRVAAAADLPVLLGSVPLPRAGGRGLPLLVRSPARRAEAGGARWDQDVEVLLGDRLVLRRRAGRWRPTPAAVAPVALGVAAAALAGLGALLVGRFVVLTARRRHGGGATG